MNHFSKTFLLNASLLVAVSATHAQEVTHEGNGMKIEKGGMTTEVKFYSPEIVRIFKYQSKDPKSHSDQKYSVSMRPQTNITVNYAEDASSASLASNAVTVKYNMADDCVSFHDASGRMLISEKGKGANMTSTTDGRFNSYRVRQTFTLDPDEVIYGLGQIQDGQLNHRNMTYNYMIQNNCNVWIPYIHSVKGYGLYWDIYSPTTFTDNSSGMTFESSAAHAIDYYVLAGSPTDGDACITRMRELTGKSQMVPLWSYGYFQSKERYTSANETMSVVKKYRDLGVPLDCIVQDWQYWGGNNKWNAMEFLNPQFNNYQQMIDSVHRMDAKILISFWANFGPDTKQYAWLKEHNALMKHGNNVMTSTWPTNSGVGVYNPYSEEARDYYWKCLNEGITSKGIDAYWMDSSEPDHYENETDREITMNFEVGEDFTWRSVRNAFPLVHVEGVGTRHRADAEASKKRVMIMTRSGYPGQQRVGAGTWSGDVSATWDVLRKQIPTALNFSVCGIPSWNSDTGGFFGGNPGDPSYNELYARWIQFSTFCAIMRSHGSGVDRAIYQFGTRGTPIFDNIDRYINLRYALLPYIYSTAHDVSSNDFTFMRALGLAYPADRQAVEVKDAFLFGRSLLVAPVLDPGVTNRDVYLPGESEKWTDFWTGESLNGGQSISKPVDIHTMPIYVKSGSIVPWGPKVQYSTEQGWDSLEIRIYPGADGSFTLYEDEFDNYNYENGQCTEIPFTWNEASQQLTIGQRKGSYNGMKPHRKFRIVLVDADNNLGLGSRQSVRFSRIIDYTGEPVSVKLDNNDIVLNGYTPLTSLTLGNQSANLYPGQEVAVNATAHYADGTSENVNLYVTYSSSNPQVITTTGSGLKAVGEGTAVVTVNYTDQAGTVKTEEIRVNVTIPEKLYTFKASEWKRVEDRVTASNISYDTKENTITVKQAGTMNTALRYEAADNYIEMGKKYLVIRGTNLSTTTSQSSIWYLNDEWLNQSYPTSVYKLSDGDIVLVWDMSNYIGKSYTKTGRTLFGLTSTTGTSVIKYIGYEASAVDYVNQYENITYTFHATDWKTGASNRVPQNMISYDTDRNTITVKAGMGANNVCLQLSANACKQNAVKAEEKYMTVVASNIKTDVGSSYLWWLNGVNNGSEIEPNEVRTFNSPEGQLTLVAWDMTRSTLDKNNIGDAFSICQGNTIFGLTSSTGTSVIYHIGFHQSLDEFISNFTSIPEIYNSHKATNGDIYNLAGIKTKVPTTPGIYISNGKKFIVE